MSVLQESFALERWNPVEQDLKNSTIVIIGKMQSGKSTALQSFTNLQVYEFENGCVKNYDNPSLIVGSYTDFLQIKLDDLPLIDLIIFRGLPSHYSVHHLFEYYDLFGLNVEEFYEILKNYSQNYQCLVLEIASHSRLRGKRPNMYFFQ
jgi:hypothetical protein